MKLTNESNLNTKLNAGILIKKIFLLLLSCIAIDSFLTKAIAFELLEPVEKQFLGSKTEIY